MKHAKEVIELLSCFPHRWFKMRHIVGHVRGECRRSSARQIRRVLNELEEIGSIEVARTEQKGSSNTYKWKS